MKEWKGRFRKPLDPAALAFSTSLEIDRRLAAVDIAGSIAHAEMLASCRIISAEEGRTLVRGLRQLLGEVTDGKAPWLRAGEGGRFVAEDVHMAVEQRLMEKVGPVGGKLHTARSRNDQVALDVRLYLRAAIDHTTTLVRSLQRALVEKAAETVNVLMPGYTHLQRAQPVLLAHHLLAYVEMFERDRERFTECRVRANRSPLGAAALAGTSFPIDRHQVARRLKFTGVVENSIDAVSDRDAVVEFISAAAIAMMHASRFAEELVLWSSREWRFADIGEEFTTGSSIMPQKKNPDMAELVRGKTGRVYGDLVAVLTTMKGLPLAYNRDMQEDKEPLFDAVATVTACLDILARMIPTVAFDARRFDQELNSDHLLATEVADYLARKGVPFREAHGIVGDLVVLCQERGVSLGDLPFREYLKRSPAFERDIIEVLDARTSLSMKRSGGSTSPLEVEKALRRWKRTLVRR